MAALTRALYTTRLVCAYCQTVLRYGQQPESHGICNACADRMERQLIARRIEAQEIWEATDAVARSAGDPRAEFPTSLAIPRGTTERREP